MIVNNVKLNIGLWDFDRKMDYLKFFKRLFLSFKVLSEAFQDNHSFFRKIIMKVGHVIKFLKMRFNLTRFRIFDRLTLFSLKLYTIIKVKKSFIQRYFGN